MGGLLAIVFGGAFDVGVSIPTCVVDVDEADAALDHASGEKAGAGEGVLVAVATVKIDRFVGLGFEVHELGCGTLKAGGHFIRGHAGGDFLIVDGREALGVELVDEIEGIGLELGRESFRGGDVEDGVFAFSELDAGVGGGKEAGGPEGGAAGEACAGGHDDEGGEVVSFRPESVEGP